MSKPVSKTPMAGAGLEEIAFGLRSGFRVPRANIGGMRLPQDTDEAVALIRHAIDSGMRYIDTSRGYGDSEIKIGKALKDGYRRKVILSTKWSPWVQRIEDSDDTSADCMLKRIEESMRRLDVDYLDYYQLWNIESREHYDQALVRGGMLDGIRKAIDRGWVGHTGFTTHDTLDNLRTYLAEADWCEIVLFTCSLLDPTYEEVIADAHARGIGTIIMNPLAGGLLAQESPVLGALAREFGARSIPELAIRFLISNPAVTTLISGISRTSDVDDTLAAVRLGPLPAEAMERIRGVLSGIHAHRKGFCTGCRYCLPCPAGIEIPAVMGAIAQSRYWGLEGAARNAIRDMKGAKPDACTRCGECETRCTQRLPIMEEMAFAARNLTGE